VGAEVSGQLAMKYYLWEMDTKGDSRRIAESPSVSEMFRDIVPIAQALKLPKYKLLYLQAWCPVRGGLSSYPWSWSGGRLLPRGDLRRAARRMLRRKRVRLK